MVEEGVFRKIAIDVDRGKADALNRLIVTLAPDTIVMADESAAEVPAARTVV